MKKSELLLPVGNMEMCLAAIHGGADAIYVGMPGFNARGRTVDHTLEELKEMIDLCHLYGVHVHVAFNILIFEDEITQAIAQVKKVIPLGPDALIIQDLGLLKVVREICPDQVIHGSTQMTITNSDAIHFLNDLNIDRFVLARENSISEIEEIRSKTTKELEVFVHGALCVAYSGQCFTSESIGGRSANRGQCAQSCRFGYEMYVDGEMKNLVDKDYLVSPKDLCGIEQVSKLQEIGVESFKVEGRLKTPAYVGMAASSYKKALETNKIDSESVENMSLTYSRGFFSGWLDGVDHQNLVAGNYQSHRGIKLGKIERVNRGRVLFKSDTDLKNGMGVGIFNDESKKELGSSIYSVSNERGFTSIELSKDFPLKDIRHGDEIYLTSNPEIAKNVEKMVSDLQKQRRVNIEINLSAHVGQVLKLEYTDQSGLTAISSAEVLDEAKKPIDTNKLKKDISALSRTVYFATKIDMSLSKAQPFIPSKVLKKLRQECVEKLNQQRIAIKEKEMKDILYSIKDPSENEQTLSLLLRTSEQVDSLLPILSQYQGSTKLRVILDFEFGKEYQAALTNLRAYKELDIGIATNRILKPKEYHHLNTLLRLEPDFILSRNLGAFQYLKEKNPEIRILGDFSLNVANSQTANYLLDKGFESLMTSYDLNSMQVEKLLDNTDAGKIEVNIHQYMPSFHMEHCVFAAFLSNGSSFKDCGKPCEKHQVELKDQFGNRHFIKADQECRNTMFNANAQSAINIIQPLFELGVRTFRVEFLDESKELLTSKLSTILSFLDNDIDQDKASELLKTNEKYGLGTGRLFKADTYIDRKKS